jgi:uncharacterized iron-regulated membrane protein
MTRSGIRTWYLIHKWSSLISTLFLLMLCVTGLPLIFHEELEDALDYNAPLSTVQPGTPAPTLDQIVADVLKARPGEVVQYASFDEEQPVVIIGTAPSVTAPADQVHNQPVDLRTGRLLPPPPQQEGFLYVMLTLHTEMFAGLPGTLFLGVMGVLFVLAVVSGVVVYAPFMRKLDFGTVRAGRSRRLKWLDLHNLLGIAVTAWLLVVGVTGIFNTLDQPLAMQWRMTQLADMMAPYKNAPPLQHLGSVDKAVEAAEAASPGMVPVSISWPGSFFSTPHHYNVFLKGATPVTSRLLKPAIVDAEMGVLTDTRDMPLHIRALFLSRPLHFGDYGGLPLKIVWAFLDLAAIAILASGLYLWLGRRRAPIEKRVEELASGGLGDGA